MTNISTIVAAEDDKPPKRKTSPRILLYEALGQRDSMEELNEALKMEHENTPTNHKGCKVNHHAKQLGVVEFRADIGLVLRLHSGQKNKNDAHNLRLVWVSTSTFMMKMIEWIKSIIPLLIM